MTYKYSNDFSISQSISTVCSCLFTYCRFFKIIECYSCMSNICFCWDLHLYMNTIWMNTLSTKHFYSKRRCCTLFLCFFCNLLTHKHLIQYADECFNPPPIPLLSFPDTWPKKTGEFKWTEHPIIQHCSYTKRQWTNWSALAFTPPPPIFLLQLFTSNKHWSQICSYSVLNVLQMDFGVKIDSANRFTLSAVFSQLLWRLWPSGRIPTDWPFHLCFYY